MEILLKVLMKLFPEDWVLILNERSLEELDRRNLIVWTDEMQFKDERIRESY